MSKISFITFGGPTQNYHDAVTRICEQASKFNLFNSITGYTEQDLQNDPVFWEKHKLFIENNKRGYGYWLWKPYLILKKLHELDNDDILLYLDCGCELYPPAVDDMLSKIAAVNKYDIIGSNSASNDITFTKSDLVHYMEMQNSQNLLEIPHMQSGVVFIKKTDMTLRLYTEFYNICSENYHFIDDSPSLIPNDSSFIEHRHDQCVFNLLVKKYGMHNVCMEPMINGPDGVHLIEDKHKMSIWILRNCSGKSYLE